MKAVSNRPFIDDLLVILDQGIQLLDCLDDELYSRAFPDLRLSSIGDHYRHHLDHVAAFVRGVDSGKIDYDDRRRDPRIATERVFAMQRTDQLIEKLEPLAREVEEKQIFILHRTRDDDRTRRPIPSCLHRETAFVISHAVHHYAIMAIAARHQGVAPPKNLGVMPSTLRHKKAIAQAEGAAK